jgi:hypothetical protein
MPNRDLDDDAVDETTAEDQEEDVFGNADDDDDEEFEEDDEDETFDDENEARDLTGEVGSEGGSPGDAVERIRSRSDVGGSEAAGIRRDEPGETKSRLDEAGEPRRKPS